MVSNTSQNEVLDGVVVVPLSTSPGETWPLRIRAGQVEGKQSFMVLPGIRQVSKSRIERSIGPASQELVSGLDGALMLYLGD